MSEVEELLEMAEEAYSDSQAEEVSDRVYWSSLYYSVFYAAKATLLAIGEEPGTHSGTDNLVGKALYKEEGLIDSGTASFYSNLRRIREEITYEPGAEIVESRERTETRVREFIERMKEIVASEE